MSWKLPPERARLLALAIAQEHAEPAIRDGWQAIVSAVLHGWILPGDGHSSLTTIIARLQRRALVTEEDYTLEVSDETPEQLLVTLMGDSWTVPTQPFLAALRQLDADFRAGKGLTDAP